MKNHHADCKFYVPTDVFKGICRLDKSKINADDNVCGKFINIPKCKYCDNFTDKGNYLGLCMEKSDAYAEMIAKTCIDFKWK